MLRYVIVKGLQYKGETIEDMARREKRMEEHNRLLDEMIKRNSLPMPAMRQWAKDHDYDYIQKTNRRTTGN